MQIKILKKFTLDCLINFFSKIWYGYYSTLSFSQEGEDMILRRIFDGKKKGVYVDVGAHHPKRFSNTYSLYREFGWSGINIEPNPDLFNLFNSLRRRDINLNIGISCQSKKLDYYMFDEPALNTFDVNVLNDRLSQTRYKHIKTISVEVEPLSDIFDKYLNGQRIDFLSIDVEGFDLDVLKSNDWEKYRPSWVLTEQLNLSNIESLDFEIHEYMKSINYVLFAKTFNTLFYKEARK
tara:strand:+ start:18175 stop:18882 length:708 start_codon:yes stop_codon:yes gene_type:complete